MLSVCTTATDSVWSLLTARDGLSAQLGLLRQSGVLASDSDAAVAVERGHYSSELADRAKGAKYPHVVVYCVRVENSLRQKFQTFSGRVDLVIEIRHSSDRLERLESEVQVYLEAILNVITRKRGDWGEGVYFSGRYDVRFEAVGRGGKNFSQIATVGLSLEVDVP